MTARVVRFVRQAATLLDALTVEELGTLGHLIDKLVARAEEIATASEEE